MFACTRTHTEYITATAKPHIMDVCLILINNFNAGYLIENRKIDGNNQCFSLFFRSFNSEILSNSLVMESFPVTDDIPIRLSNLRLCTMCSSRVNAALPREWSEMSTTHDSLLRQVAKQPVS